MNTLFVFGDSFAQDWPGSWTILLSKMRNMKLNNYGLGGSCLEYSLIKLLEVSKQQKFNSGDIVIFVLTNPSRLDLEEFVTSNATSSYMIHHKRSIEKLNDKDFLVKYHDKRSKDMIENKHILYLSFLKVLASQNPEVQFLAIPAFPQVQTASIIENTSNFLFVNKLCLMDISNYEWNYWKVKEHAIMDILGFDPRTNHLTNPNLRELANAINEVINSWNINHLYIKRFKKNIINKDVSTVEDVYKHYVDTGLISKENTDMLKLNNNTLKRKKRWIIF